MPKLISSNQKSRKPELLAPAGDLRKLKYALTYGADAIYCGLPQFSLRAKTGFDFNSLVEGIIFAHQNGKKVHVTINVFAHNRHIKTLPSFLKKINKIKPDALIVSDPGVLLLVKKYCPKIPIHLSTQANTLNCEAVKFWQKQGVSRIILGREISLGDIKEIRKAAPKMELEMFVHGAMCMSYSGRCYLSAWLASTKQGGGGLSNRSANEGLCAQPCRWEYNVYLEERQRPGQMIPVEIDDSGTYFMNSKDLCLVEYLHQLVNAGVSSFKIEGRTKSVYYVAVASKAYRQALDSMNNPEKIKEIKKELFKIDNRGYTTGFLLGTKSEEIDRHEFNTTKNKSDWVFAGEVVSVKTKSDQNIIYIKPHNVLKAGESVELITPDNCYKIKIKEFIDKNGKALNEIHGGTSEIYSFELSKKYNVPEMSLIRFRNSQAISHKP